MEDAYDSDEFEDRTSEDPAKLIKDLFTAWVNEKGAPELLDYAKDAVTQLLDKVVQQESATREMGRDNLTKHFLLHIFQVEIVRIKYLLKAYLRTRQIKIEKHCAHILNPSYPHRSRLSPAELRYAESYKRDTDELKAKSFLQQLPDTVSKAARGKPDETESVPNERTYVFCYVLSDLGNLQIDTTVNIALNTGNIYVVRYDLIASYLADKKVKLL